MQTKYEEIWPSELGDLGVPVWGDSVTISPDAQASLTIGASEKRADVMLGSFPKAPVSGSSMKTLLKAVTGIRLVLTKKCTAGPLSPHSAEEVAVEVKTALEHYRSILDYLAHDFHRLCKWPPGSPKPRKSYFPIAGASETHAKFHERFQKEYPHLAATAPTLFRHVIDIQRFSGETWLNDLATLVNPMKHRQLAAWEEIDCKSLIIHHAGIGLRLGELGLKSISIPKGHEIRFRSPRGVERAIRGPQEIDANTTTLRDADPEIMLDQLTWKTTAIKGTGRSIAGLLAQIDGGVRRVCLEAARALHP